MHPAMFQHSDYQIYRHIVKLGYATNLTSFVNRFNSEKTTKAITDSNN